jgi:ribA/ribD-fused uncharacterized protein
MSAILEFKGDYRFLSNFWLHEESPSMRTVEHYYQAAKVGPNGDMDKYSEILTAITPGLAKRLGAQVELRPDWEFVKDSIMAYYVGQKFARNAGLAKQLIDTGNVTLYEGNTWGDTYWGVDLATGEGQNKLGLILMSVRATLSAEKDLLLENLRRGNASS